MACRRRQSRNVVSPRRIVRQVRSTSTYCVAPEGRKQSFCRLVDSLSVIRERTGQASASTKPEHSLPSVTLYCGGKFSARARRFDGANRCKFGWTRLGAPRLEVDRPLPT